jgi:ABC-type nitrate/sulfonate/bicarbonate transport system ATPase subunit
MCQRASLARALIGNPQALLLDEPLGALDAFTRMNMQDELLRIKKEQNMTMIMVTHDVDEAVYLADQIVVMTPRPAKIEKVLEVKLSQPRDRNNPEFIRLRSEILKILDFAGKEATPEYNI